MKETKEMLGFILSLGNALGQSLDDKKLDMSDALNFWEPLSKTPEAFEGMSEILSEYKRATPEDLKELHAYAVKEFDIPQDSIELKIEKGIKAGIALLELVAEFR